MRWRFVTCSWCLISSLGEPTRRALCVVYRGAQGLRDHPVQGLGLRPWRSPRLLVPGPGHTPAPTGSGPHPQSKLCSLPPVPWTWASGREEERPALSLGSWDSSVDASIRRRGGEISPVPGEPGHIRGRGHPAERRRGRPCPHKQECALPRPRVRGGTLPFRTVPGGDLKAAAPPADTLGSVRVHSSFYNPPRAFGRALLLWQLLRVLAGPGCSAGQEPREARLLEAGGHTAAPPGSLSARLAVCSWPAAPSQLWAGRASARHCHRDHQPISVQRGGGRCCVPGRNFVFPWIMYYFYN